MSQWWVQDVLASGGTVMLAAWVFWIIVSICLHELGHGFAALSCGDDTPRTSGHMTLSPLVHMGWVSLLVFAAVGFTWGAMPVNPSRFRGRYDDAKVAFAGPMVNLLLAGLLIVLTALWTAGAGGGWTSAPLASPGVLREVFVFLSVGAVLNRASAILNLAPLPPLDGSRIVASFVPPMRRLFETEGAAVASLIGLVLLMKIGGGPVFGLSMDATMRAVDRVTTWITPAARAVP
jgi:Zn-dependent protease